MHAPQMKPIAIVSILCAFAALAGAIMLGLIGPPASILVKSVVATPIAGAERTLHVFLKIENSGSADVLLSASSPEARKVEVFSPEAEAGVPIPAFSTPSLAPDGAHIVIDEVAGEVAEGRILPLSLKFDRGGVINTRATIGLPAETGNATHAGLFGIGHILPTGGAKPAPQVSIHAARKKGGPGWTIHADVANFMFSEQTADQTHVPGTGHGHLYVGGLKIGRIYSNVVEIGDLPPGKHVIRLTLNTNDHRAYVVGGEPVTATTTVQVPDESDTISASAGF